MPGYLKPYVDSLKKMMRKKGLTLEIFKKKLIDYKSNFISFAQLRYFYFLQLSMKKRFIKGNFHK